MKKINIYWIIFITLTVANIYLACISWESIRAQVGWVKTIPQSTDFKLRHIVQFAPLAISFIIALKKSTQMVLSKIYIICFVVILFQASLSEFIQIYAPNRLPSFLDVFWSTVGGVVGIISHFVFIRILSRK